MNAEMLLADLESAETCSASIVARRARAALRARCKHKGRRLSGALRCLLDSWSLSWIFAPAGPIRHPTQGWPGVDSLAETSLPT